MDHKYKVRIYYEDTDAGGVVFYANYFKFTERARTELIYEKLKLKHLELKEKFDVIFVVKSLSSKYIAPARFEDDLIVVSKIVEKSPVRLVLEQNIEKANKLIFVFKNRFSMNYLKVCIHWFAAVYLNNILRTC